MCLTINTNKGVDMNKLSKITSKEALDNKLFNFFLNKYGPSTAADYLHRGKAVNNGVSLSFQIGGKEYFFDGDLKLVKVGIDGLVYKV